MHIILYRNLIKPEMAVSKRLLTNAKLATLTETGAPYGLIEERCTGDLAGGRIAWVGKTADALPSRL